MLVRLRVQYRCRRTVARAHGDGCAAGPGRRGVAVVVRQGQHDGGRGSGDRRAATGRRESAVAGDGPPPMRVLVAMSGGVDSSVAAALLVEQGHEVIGATM